MIITGQNIFPIATQKNLSYNINFTPKDFSLSTISFKENKDFTFTLQSGKFSDINNKSIYFYNTGENINLSGNIHHLQQNNFNSWSGSEKFLYDYYINGNPIILSGQRTGLMNNDPTGYSKISGLTFSGSNLELTNFQVFGVSPLVNLELAPSFSFGQLITGFLRYPNSLQESCRILSGSVTLPTGFVLNSIPQRLSGLTNASGGFNITTNLGSQYSDIPLTYNITLNLLTDFGLLSKSFTTTGLPNNYVSFFINVNGSYFDLYNTPSGATYSIESSFFSGNQEYEKSIRLEFNYATGGTGLQEDSTSFYGSGLRNFNLDIIVTGTGVFQQTGTGFASGFINGIQIFGTGNLSGSFQTGITGGNFQKVFMISGSGHANTNHFNLTSFVISGYRTGIWSSGTIVRSGTLTGYVYPFLSGSGTATFSNGFRSILSSDAPLGIVRSTQIFTGIMIYRISNSGMVKITGFNSTYLDYSGYSAGRSLTGLLEGSGLIYSALLSQIETTGILRSELNNRRITGRRDLFITEYVTNTGINLARIVTMVSGEATGNYLNNPDIFGLTIAGTGQNIITGRNTINGQGFITGFGTGYIIKDNYITTGFVSGVFLYQATGNPNNLADSINIVTDSYFNLVTGNITLTGFNSDVDIFFSGEKADIKLTGLIISQGIIYSNPVSFTGVNTLTYNSLSGGLKTGRFVKIFDNVILQKSTYFTGTGLFTNRVFSTGTSSGINWTYFNGSGGVMNNKTFTGNINIGSGEVFNRQAALPFTTSGTASGQIGNFLLAGPRFGGGTYTSTLKNEFFTGNKIEFRQIIISGIATGTKYNYQGLIIDYSGYIFSSGSGNLIGSGYIMSTGQGILTGNDGSTGLFSVTGETFVLLTGNPNNLADPVNIHYRFYDNIVSTGSGFYRIENFSLDLKLTGVTYPLTLTGGKNIFQEGDLLLKAADGFYIGSGSNLASNDSRTLFSGQLFNPSFTGSHVYYTGISQQIIQDSVSGIMTGINNNFITGVTFYASNEISLTGLLTLNNSGSGILQKTIYNASFFGYSMDDIRNDNIEWKNQILNITSGNQPATGKYRITGRHYLLGEYSGRDSMNMLVDIYITAVDQTNGLWTGTDGFGSVETGVFTQKLPCTGHIDLLNVGVFNDFHDVSGEAFGFTTTAYSDYYGIPYMPYTIAAKGLVTGSIYFDFTGTGIITKNISAGSTLYIDNQYITGVTGLWLGTGYYKFSSGVVFSNTNNLYSNGILTGEIIGPYPNVFSETNLNYSGIKFYSKNGSGNRIFPYTFNAKITGKFSQSLIGSGFMSESKNSIATGIFYLASGIISNKSYRTGYKDFNITGFFTTINGYVDWTGNMNTGLGLKSYIYTGTTLLNDIRGRIYEKDIFKTGYIELPPSRRLIETSIESNKYFYATGYINFSSGIDFDINYQGKRPINGILITGSGAVILPNNVFAISNLFTGRYDFISTGTGFMTVTGSRQIIITDFLTGITGIWETTGFCLITGITSLLDSDEGYKSISLYFTGIPDTGTVYPTNSVYKNLWSIKSGFDHITESSPQPLFVSGLMTGYLTLNQEVAARSGISGDFEFRALFTGNTSGIITGISGQILVSITGGSTSIFSTYPYVQNSSFSEITGAFRFLKTFIRTGIFEGTGLTITSGSYRSKTNFLVSGLATGYFQITGTGSVDLTGSVVLNRNQTLLVNYPYPSGNSIAYITVTGLNNFTGDFRSGVKITGLYNKNYVGFFSGSVSGSYTGTWSGTGLFTGSNNIPFFDTDFGVKSSALVASALINSGLESGLVPVFTIGLYSGLKTIQNITLVENRDITGSGYFERISSGFALAGTTSGSGIGLVTGYLSGFINKNYTGGINLETGLRLTGYLSGNANIVLTGIFTGTIQLTGRILRSFSLISSGVATGYYLANKSFTGGFELYTGVTLTGEFIKINPTSQTGWALTTNIKTGQILYLQINSTNIFDNISGYFNASVFSGGLVGSVDNNIIYASRLY